MKRSAVRATSGTIEALIYTRVSSDRQTDGASLDVQLSEARAYATRQQFALGREFTDIMSGKRDDRPQYQVMLEEVRRLSGEGRRVAVVVWRLDRLGRRLLERVQRRSELHDLGATTHSVMEGGEVTDLVANILGSVAEEEVRVLGERVRGSRRHLRLNGWYPVQDVPFGYMLRDATPEERAAGAPRRVLDIDEASAKIARDCFERVARGESIRSVARWMIGLSMTDRRGHTWSATAVRKLIASPTYVARFPRDDDGDVLEGSVARWPALVSDDLYRRCRDEIEIGRKLAKQATQRFLLSGFARCPRCGHRMVGWRATNRRPRYVCDRNGCSGNCGGPTLDKSVLDRLTPLVAHVATADGRMQRAIRREWDMLRGAGATTPDGKRLSRLRAEVDHARKRLADAAVLLIDGMLDRAGYDAARTRIEADLIAAEAEIGRLEQVRSTPSLPDLEVVLAAAGGWAGVLDRGSVEARRRVLVELIDHVRPVRQGHGVWFGELVLTPLGEALLTLDRATRTAA
ncbi:MAG: recombinase family protein [Chloroflexota bacterium]|nr:recombinase family protein [Chloroflexota bacterium]